MDKQLEKFRERRKSERDKEVEKIRDGIFRETTDRLRDGPVDAAGAA